MKNKKSTLKRVLACVMVVLMAVTAVPMSGFVGLELPKWSQGLATRASAEDLYFEGDYTYTVSYGKATIKCGHDNAISGDLNIPSELGGYPVTAISNNAFIDFTKITSVIIPDTVIKIGSSAFCRCTGIKSITIGKGVTSIGNGAFSNCTSLTKIIWKAETVNDVVDAFYCAGLNGEGIDVVFEDNVKRIPSNLFYENSSLYCPNVKFVTIGSNVVSIGNYAFNNCNGLTRINWNAENVSDLDWNCYVFNNAGTSGDGIDVVFGNDVKSIPACIFKSCDGLTSITMSDSVTRIGYSAFYGCTSLTNITIPDSVTNIDSEAFDNTAWYNAQPYGDVYVGKVYYDYKGTMPKNTSVIIKDGTKGIAGSAFSNCDGLTSITIPDSVTRIGGSAFYGCTSLTNITIPDSVAGIDGSAFYGCTSLTNITLPDSVTRIGSYAFYGCASLKSITIPNGVTSIGSSTFRDCSRLSSVIISDSVTSIGEDAFHDCGLTSVLIPDSVTNIGYGAFSDCHFLTSVTIGNGVETIKGSDCMDYYSTFEECPLTTIKLGKSIKTIEAHAFNGIKSIPEIYYAGSEADWKKVSIDQSNDMILRATMYYNVDITHTHSYTSTITKKATCTESGVKTFTCDCGKTVTKSIPATGHKYKTENQAATCTSIGVSIKKCTVCGKVEYANTTPATGHTLKTDVEPATFTESGLSITSCKTCGTITKATLIKRIASVTLPATKYAYNGKTQTPTVVVKDSSGKVLKNKTDYTVSYASGRKNPGKYAVKVTFKGNYTGTKTLYFTISPTAPSLTVTAGAKKATLKWNKQVGATGYVVYMATSQNGKYTKIAAVKGNSAVSYTKTGLTTGKTYYFKVAAYTTVGKSNIYSAWSSVKGVKIK